jgi:PAS domain-containing protein
MAQKSSYKKSEQRVREFGKQAEQTQQSHEKLRESEARFRTLFENGPEAMVIIDAETGKFVDANPKALRLFKLGREEFIGLGPLDISPPQQPDGRTLRRESKTF